MGWSICTRAQTRRCTHRNTDERKGGVCGDEYAFACSKQRSQGKTLGGCEMIFFKKVSPSSEVLEIRHHLSPSGTISVRIRGREIFFSASFSPFDGGKFPGVPVFFTNFVNRFMKRGGLSQERPSRARSHFASFMLPFGWGHV